MAEITGFAFLRHLRADASSHVPLYRAARLARSGRGLSFWFRPFAVSLAEVPVDDREITLAVHGRTADRLTTGAQAAGITAVEGARNAIEREKMEVLSRMPPAALAALAARELAGRLQRIEHLNITPDVLAPLLSGLIDATTRKLQAEK